MSSDPIHQNEEGKWCFWDETWSDEIGLYETREEAERVLAEYCRYLDGEN